MQMQDARKQYLDLKEVMINTVPSQTVVTNNTQDQKFNILLCMLRHLAIHQYKPVQFLNSVFEKKIGFSH